MNENLWNPAVRNAAVFEKPLRTKLVRAYEFRLFFVLSGGAALEVEGEKKLKLAPGNLCLIPPAVGYKLKADYCRLFSAAFDLSGAEGDYVPAVPDELFDRSRAETDTAPFDRFIFAEDMSAERDAVLRMHEIYSSGGEHAPAKVSALLKLLLIRLYETTAEDALPPRLVEALDAYIRENAADDLSGTEVGAIFGYHPFYISQLLKSKKGVTLKQYINACKLRRARDLLRYSGKTTAQIAEETGFTDASYFTKSFKAAYGVTPKDFRGSVADETP